MTLIEFYFWFDSRLHQKTYEYSLNKNLSPVPTVNRDSLSINTKPRRDFTDHPSARYIKVRARVSVAYPEFTLVML